MSPSEVGRLCRGMPGLRWLDLTGGEPMLRPDVLDVFGEVLRNTPSLCVLHFPTNGSFPDRAVGCARAVRLERPDVTLLVTVSVDGPPEVHDLLRGRRGSYEGALRTARSIAEVHGAEVHVGTTLGPGTVGSLGALRERLASDLPGFTSRRWHWNLGQVSGHFFGNEPADVAIEPDLAARLMTGQFRRRWPPRGPVDLMELGFLATMPTWLLRRRTRLPCPALRSTCFVSADAVLYPCHVWDRPLLDLRAVGFDLAHAWQDPSVLRARRQVARLRCGGCFTPCEAYPALAASPLRAAGLTAWRGARMLGGGGRGRA